MNINGSRNINKYILSNFSSVDSPYSVLTKIYQKVEKFRDASQGYDNSIGHLENAQNTKKWLELTRDSVLDILDGESEYYYDWPKNKGKINTSRSSENDSATTAKLLHGIGWNYFGSIHPDKSKSNSYRELTFSIIPRMGVPSSVSSSGYLVAIGVLQGDSENYGRYKIVNNLESAKDYIKSVLLHDSKNVYYSSFVTATYRKAVEEHQRKEKKNPTQTQLRKIRSRSEEYAFKKTESMFSDNNIDRAFFLLDEAVDLTTVPDMIESFLMPLAENNVEEARKYENQVRAMNEERLLSYNNEAEDLDESDVDDIEEGPVSYPNVESEQLAITESVGEVEYTQPMDSASPENIISESMNSHTPVEEYEDIPVNLRDDSPTSHVNNEESDSESEEDVENIDDTSDSDDSLGELLSDTEDAGDEVDEDSLQLEGIFNTISNIDEIEDDSDDDEALEGNVNEDSDIPISSNEEVGSEEPESEKNDSLDSTVHPGELEDLTSDEEVDEVVELEEIANGVDESSVVVEESIKEFINSYR